MPIGTDIATARNNLVEALKLSEKSEDFKLKAYPVGTAGVFLEHTDPEDLGAGSLALDIIADFQHSSNMASPSACRIIVTSASTMPWGSCI